MPAGGISIVNADPTGSNIPTKSHRSDELQMPGVMGYMAGDLRNSLTSGLDVKVSRTCLQG